jgi:hypothetical protein
MINSIVLMFMTAIGTFLVQRHFHVKNRRLREEAIRTETAEKIQGRVTELEKQLALVGQQIQPISTAFQAMLVKELTHFHTPEMDALMVKLGPPYELTPEEELKLIAGLKERAESLEGVIPESEREAATMLPMVMRRVRNELVHESDKTLVTFARKATDAVILAAGEKPNERRRVTRTD